jgi:hypothetical protein
MAPKSQRKTPTMEKPKARGPAPDRKAARVLGKKLNRKAKPPPTFPGGKIERNAPAARRLTKDEAR